MSRNQKAPLLAFVLVAIICALVLVDTIRGEASERPVRSVTTSELGPAYPLAVEPDPIAPNAGSPEHSSAPADAATRTSGSPDRLDAAPTQPRGAASPRAVGRRAGFPSAGTGEAAAARRRASEGELSYDAELWPQSTVPGVQKPIVAFTIFIPDADASSEQPEPPEQPPAEPTADADSDSDGAEPSESGQSPPGDGPEEHQPDDLGATP